MTTLSGLLAGLGLFFIGIRLIGTNLQQAASGPIRKLLARALEHPGAAPVAGLVSGALTQSTSAATFVATSLVAAGTLAMPSAVAMLSTANVGTSVLVLLAAFDLKGMVFYLLALTGWSFFIGLDQAERHRHVVYAALGLGLLLLGLTTIKMAAGDLQSDPWVREFVEFAATHVAAGFLAAFIVAVAAQSASIVAVLALPLVHEGLISFDQTLMLTYGANVGSGFAVLLLAAGMKGSARQLALCQALLRAAAAVVLVPFYVVEHHVHIPLVAGFLEMLSKDAATRSSLAYLLFQLLIFGGAMLFRRQLITLTARLAPPDEDDSLQRASFIYDEAVADPATALDLAGREFGQLLAQLPEYLDGLRSPAERRRPFVPVGRRVKANAAVLAELQAFLDAILKDNPQVRESQAVYHLKERALTLRALQQTLAEFAQDLGSVAHAELPAFSQQLVEGLHAILLVAEEAHDPDSVLLLKTLTADRGSLMERVRREILGGASSLNGREALLSATLRFERILWLLRQLVPVPADDEVGRLAS